MLHSWLFRTLTLGFVLAGATVQGANPVASKLWTLVGCDDVDLDGLISDAALMADAAISALNDIIHNPILKIEYGSSHWYHARNTLIFWGTEYKPLEDDQDQIEFDGDNLNIMINVRGERIGFQYPPSALYTDTILPQRNTRA